MSPMFNIPEKHEHTWVYYIQNNYYQSFYITFSSIQSSYACDDWIIAMCVITSPTLLWMVPWISGGFRKGYNIGPSTILPSHKTDNVKYPAKCPRGQQLLIRFVRTSRCKEFVRHLKYYRLTVDWEVTYSPLLSPIWWCYLRSVGE
jgi:hypothetical protein